MSNRPERPSKKQRRLSTDSEGSEDEVDWSSTTKQQPKTQTRPSGDSGAEKATATKTETPRSRRTAPGNVSMATVERGPLSASSSSPSMRLTVKTSSSKLREATRTNTASNVVAVNSRDAFVGGEVLEGKRQRNVRKSYVVEESENDSEDDEEEEDEEMEDAADEDAEGEDEDDEIGDEDAEGDIDMDIPPPPPVIKISKAQSGKQSIIVKPPTKVDTKTVEQKEVEEERSDDDELSELDSDLGVDDEEAMQTGNEEDAEGEDEEIEDEEEENPFGSDEETPGGGSRASTPDVAKLTVRQRARLEEGGSGHLLALPDEVQVKKHLTAEEHAMRRAEMARRRKNLSEKRNEEEKMETINKLLKKQAPKTNARRGAFNADPGELQPDDEGYRAGPMIVRWVSNKDGNRIGVPDEWLEGPIGSVFTNSVKPDMGGKLIREVA